MQVFVRIFLTFYEVYILKTVFTEYAVMDGFWYSLGFILIDTDMKRME